MEYTDYYFIGIGGIGMSAIARYFKHQGRNVSGYDRTLSPLTRQLESEGIAIHYENDITAIPRDIDKTFVIYTPAIPSDFGELEYVREKGYALVKRSKALGEISNGQKCLAISGTHGKTTTSTLLAHILTASGEGCNAFLGGISKNYGTNLLLSKNKVLVAEADEFDRSFLQLHPSIAVITATDADHLDIYENRENMLEAFGTFASQVEPSGTILIKKGVEVPEKDIRARIMRYSYNEPCDFYASDIKAVADGLFDFTLNHPSGAIPHCTLGIPGWVNVENAVAASAVALLHGVEEEKVRQALGSFSGVKRRFDIHFKSEECAYIDDYAHHPNEIKAAISSIRNIFPERRLCGIFQPHLYTRTRDFADDFAEALSGLDSLIMLPIYPAREEPLPGVTASLIFDKVSIEDKILTDKEHLMEVLAEKAEGCIVTLGAGDIDRFIDPIEQWLRERY
ncbi:MAG: UDP-N-acetylmuramate--L-alanine ligase [Bacteroidales bacterium]|nr:UDP-N-acetylmuramate--L-alanine ligase [Candidatus Cacconaster merdequi]